MISLAQYNKAWAIIQQWNKENRMGVYLCFYDDCCKRLNTTKKELQGLSRVRYLVYRRIVVAYALKQQFKMITLETIAFLMNRDHTTITYYLSRYELLAEYYDDFNEVRNHLT